MGGLALVVALVGLSACHVTPSPLGTAAAPPVPQPAVATYAQPLSLVSDAQESTVDATDGTQVAEGVREVIASRVAGLDVVQDSAGSRLRISARTSGRTPLFVVDGIPVAEGFGLSILTRAVARIDLLQDSSAIAHYGPRAVNGVVLIAMARSH